jgi:hypothetical protein
LYAYCFVCCCTENQLVTVHPQTVATSSFQQSPAISSRSGLHNSTTPPAFFIGRAADHELGSGSSRVRQAQEAWASTFEIPWAQMSDTAKEAFENKQVARKLDILKCVRLVSDEIAKITVSPGFANLGIIAGRMVAKYPASLADRIVGSDEPLAGGSTSLCRRFVRQFENRNRASKNSLKRKLSVLYDSDDDRTSPAAEGAKSSKNPANFSKDQYGCLKWQPISYPEGENEQTQEEKRVWLTNEFSKVTEQRNITLVAEYMELTYVAQRFFINKNKPPANVVKDQWPFLFTSVGMLQHFDRLMGFSLAERADKFFGEKGSILYKFAKSRQCNNQIKEVLLKLSASSKLMKNDVAKNVGSIMLLPALLKESPNELFKNFDVSKHHIRYLYCA